MQTRKIQVSFAGGEMSPEIMARTDLDKHSMGLQQCTNWLIKPSGALTYRPGFRVAGTYCEESVGVTDAADRMYSRIFTFKNSKGDDLAVRFTINDLKLAYGSRNVIHVTVDNLSSLGAIDTSTLFVDTYSNVSPMKIAYTGGGDFESRIYEGAFVQAYGANATYTPYFGTSSARKFFIVRNLDTAANTFTLQYPDGGAVPGLTFTPGTTTAAGTLTVSSSYTIFVGYTFTYSEAVAVIDALSIAQMGDTVYVAHDDYGVWRIVIDIVSGSQSSVLVENVDFSAVPNGLVPVSPTAAATSGGGSGKYYRYGIAAVSPEGVEGTMVVCNDASATNTISDITLVTLNLPRYRTLTVTKIQFTADHYIDGETVYLEGIYGVVGLNGKAFKVSKRATKSISLVGGGKGVHNLSTSWSSEPLGTGYYYLYETSGGVAISWTGTYTAVPSAGTARKAGLQNAFNAGDYNTITWTGNAFCARYIIYKESHNSGVFGYIGVATKTNFTDDNITPDTTITPKIRENPFNETANYPSALGAHDRRLVFGGTDNGPNRVWATAIKEPTAFTSGFPPLADDAFALVCPGLYGRIRHIISLDHLVLLTSREEAIVAASSNGGVNANDATVRVQSSVGASATSPVIAGENTIIFCAAAGGHVYGMTRDGDYTFKTSDLSLLATHLFDGYTIKQVAYTGGEMPVVWCLRSDGVLLGCTFIPSQRVFAWHTHEHAVGEIQSIASLRVDGADELHAMVEYTYTNDDDIVHGTHYVVTRERMRYGEGLHLDGSLHTSVLPAAGYASVLMPVAGSGDVVCVSDDADYAISATVSINPSDTELTDDATIYFDIAYANLMAIASVDAAFTGYTGARYTATARTLPLDTQTISLGDTANIVKAFVRVSTSRGLQVGTSTDDLFEPAPYQAAPYEPTPAQFSGVYEIPLPGDWTSDASIYLVQEYPFPVTITALALDVAKG